MTFPFAICRRRQVASHQTVHITMSVPDDFEPGTLAREIAWRLSRP